MNLLQNFPQLHSEDAFRDFVKSIGGDTFYFPTEIEVIVDTDKLLDLAVVKEYKWSLPSANDVATVFETLVGANYAVDVYDDISLSGCSTCDHGSEYGFCVRIWPITQKR